MTQHTEPIFLSSWELMTASGPVKVCGVVVKSTSVELIKKNVNYTRRAGRNIKGKFTVSSVTLDIQIGLGVKEYSL
jgi:hypothetical protein